MPAALPDYDYVAYIDESGDPGLATVRPNDPNGSSEWLIAAAVIVRRKDELEAEHWLEEMRSSFINFKARDIHFSKLTDRNKELACRLVARRPLKIFVVASNKKNMERYNNPFPAFRSLDRNWFYCWLTRVLLERVTYFVTNEPIAEAGRNPKIKIVFSNRGGLSYSQMKAYFELIKLQGGVGGLYLELGQVYSKVMDPRLIEIIPHYASAGLKLADVAASAFFKACDLYNTKSLDVKFAEILKSRVASTHYQSSDDYEAYTTYAGYGVKLLPSLKGAKLRREQAEIFKFYGYPRQWWDPTPPTSSPFRLATVASRNLERPE